MGSRKQWNNAQQLNSSGAAAFMRNASQNLDQAVGSAHDVTNGIMAREVDKIKRKQAIAAEILKRERDTNTAIELRNILDGNDYSIEDKDNIDPLAIMEYARANKKDSADSDYKAQQTTNLINKDAREAELSPWKLEQLQNKINNEANVASAKVGNLNASSNLSATKINEIKSLFGGKNAANYAKVNASNAKANASNASASDTRSLTQSKMNKNNSSASLNNAKTQNQKYDGQEKKNKYEDKKRGETIDNYITGNPVTKMTVKEVTAVGEMSISNSSKFQKVTNATKNFMRLSSDDEVSPAKKGEALKSMMNVLKDNGANKRSMYKGVADVKSGSRHGRRGGDGKTTKALTVKQIKAKALDGTLHKTHPEVAKRLTKNINKINHKNTFTNNDIMSKVTTRTKIIKTNTPKGLLKLAGQTNDKKMQTTILNKVRKMQTEADNETRMQNMTKKQIQDKVKTKIKSDAIIKQLRKQIKDDE